MTLPSDQARQAIADVIAAAFPYDQSWEQEAAGVLNAVMPDERTLAQWLDEVDHLRAVRDAALDLGSHVATCAEWGLLNDPELADLLASCERLDAVWGTARTLAVRDLIGHGGFTQEHYNTLTGPWRRVIGPVHPDDTPLPA